MEIHKPKAAHSWREFLVEIGTIICGILIALALEQVVSGFEWSRKVAEARVALGQELAENLGKAETRIALADCLDQRLDALSGIVEQAATSGTLPALPPPNPPPYYSWGSGVWSSALSSQTASHLPVEELRGFSRLYQLLGRIEQVEPEEEAVWTTLFGLAGPGRRFDAQDARLYRQAIGQAREYNGLISGFGVRVRQMVDGHALQFDHPMFEERTRGLRKSKLACGAPAGTPAKAYGLAPATSFAEFARGHPAR